MPDWREEARTALAKGPAALVTVLATEGSVPRGAGTRMVVTAQMLHGTIGGGALEWEASRQARAILAEPPGAWRIQDYPLGPLLGQCCGGRVRLLVEHAVDVAWAEALPHVVAILHGDRIERALGPAPPPSARGERPGPGTRFAEPNDEPRRPLLLFGAGHVGSAIAERLPGLPFDLAWFDSRREIDKPGVLVDDEDALVACARQAPIGAALLVLTHDHALDYRIVAAALQSRASFVGLIGSATKRARFTARLAADGIAADRLTCPIGLPGIAGKAPATIAISVLAQLLRS